MEQVNVKLWADIFLMTVKEDLGLGELIEQAW